jgi:hypothetical protein
MKRVLLISLVSLASAVLTFSQQAPAPGVDAAQKPGVPGVQHPMSAIIPDAEYAIKGGNPDWLAIGEDQVLGEQQTYRLCFSDESRNQ